MNSQTPPFFLLTLLLLTSFAAFGAVLPTAALPDIAHYFRVSIGQAEAIMAIYLIGYGVGQLLYGPLANCWGRKPSLMAGVAVAITGSLISIIATDFHYFALFVTARFLLAIGAAAGLVICMIVIKDSYNELNARRVFAKVILAFAFVPFLATSIGGCLTHYWNWQATNYVMIIYSLVVALLMYHFPETLVLTQRKPISLPHLFITYRKLFHHTEFLRLIALFALAGATIYVFNSLAPVVVIKAIGISPALYGWLSFIPSAGILLGGVISTNFAHRFKATTLINTGIYLILIGALMLVSLFIMDTLNLFTFYLASVLLFSGNALITPNASMQALSQVEDHANGTSIMNANVLMVSSVAVAVGGKFIETTTVALPIVLLAIGIIGVLLIVVKARAF